MSELVLARNPFFERACEVGILLSRASWGTYARRKDATFPNHELEAGFSPEQGMCEGDTTFLACSLFEYIGGSASEG
jgi:hypothetical protein